MTGQIIYDLERDKYDAIDAINYSKLKAFARSPLHYKAALEAALEDEEDEESESAALIRGTYIHTKLFEPEKFAAQYAVWDGGDRRGKAWTAFAELNASQTILKTSEVKEWDAVCAAVKSNPLAARYLGSGKSEVTLTWDLLDGRFKCKGRPDRICDEAIVDVKSTRNASKKAFEKQSASLLYHVQAAFYVDGLAQVTGETKPYVIIAVETERPYPVTVFRVPEYVLDTGREEYIAMLSKLDECRLSGEWPGYASGEVELELPRWMTPYQENA